MNITLTDDALDHVRKHLSREPGAIGLRFGLRTTGCSGYMYVVEPAKDVPPGARIAEVGDIKVIVEERDAERLDGSRIDFAKRGLNRIFVVDNPHVDEECGCGESFTFKDD